MEFNQKNFRPFDGEISARLSKLPSTYVNNSFFWWEWKIPKDTFFITFPDLEQKTFWLLAKCLSALLSKLHYASSVYHSDVFSEQFSLLAPFRCLSNKNLEFWSKGFEAIVKIASTCTDEHNEMKLVFGQKFLLFFDFWTLGIIKRIFGGKKVRHGFQNWLLRGESVLSRG